jgi:phage terminase Nu1 subunit (DNA packaging protein)
MPVPTEISIAEFAKICNRTSRHIDLLIERGALKKTGRGRLNFRAAIADYIKYQEEIITAQYKDFAPTLTAARQRLTKLKADSAVIDLRERTGALVARSEVDKARDILTQLIRDHLSQLPGKIAARLSSVSSIVEAQDLIQEELRAALDKLVSEPIVARTTGNGAQRSRGD